VCNGPGNFNGIRASISAMNGIRSVLPIELIGFNKFEMLASKNQINLVSVKAFNNQIYSLILDNSIATGQVNISLIKEINVPSRYKNVRVVGYRAEEIAKSLNIKNFEEKDSDVLDLIKAAKGSLNSDSHLAKPFYVISENSIYRRNHGPKILD
jgi:tRNA A37 threonylcarbamoyladenosine modification protein TsaB